MTTADPAEATCPFGEPIDLTEPRAAMQAFRSKSLVKSADATAENFPTTTPEGELQVSEFLDGLVSTINGAEHTQRRKLLNSLVRPASVQHLVDEIVLPAFERSVALVVEKRPDGRWGCDLAEVLDRSFLEFSAKLIGLVGVDSSEAITEIREWLRPMVTAMQSQYYDDRAAVLKRGMEFKALYVDKYFEPARAHYESMLAMVERGELDEADVPNTLMRLIVTEASPGYADEGLAVRESLLMFVAAAATGAQSIMWTITFMHQWIAEEPERRALTDDLSFWSMALQESLRLKAPFVETSARIATEDTEVSGIAVNAGQEVNIHLPRSSRNTDVFGDDAEEFNPLRKLPKELARYGFGLSNGPHQCLGLRIVIGNDGASGAHANVLKRLWDLGVAFDPDAEPQVHPRRSWELSLDDLAAFATFPVVFDNWTEPSQPSHGEPAQ